MTLKEYKEKRGYTYDELADFLEMNRGTVYNIVKGIGCITLANAHKIMSRTHGLVSYEDLMMEMEDC